MKTLVQEKTEITEKQVTKFAVRARKINLLNAKQKVAREEILNSLLEGQALPETGPYTIDLAPNGGTAWSWEEEYHKDLTAELKKQHKCSTSTAQKMAELQMKKMKDSWPEKDAITIHGKEYAGGVKLLSRVR